MFESRRPDVTDPDPARAGGRLVVGDLRCDPASLVAWIALARAGAAPTLEVVEPAAADRAQRVAAVSPTSRLPVLIEHGTTIWEPLAILEWAAERAPDLWPAHARRRAVARSIVAELHGGLAALRTQLPFDWFARFRLREEAPAAVQVDLHRLAKLWDELLDPHEAGFLFGPRVGLADLAMVPMAARLRTYGLWPREPAQRAYAERLLAIDELAHALDGLEPAPALAKPPALAVPVEAAASPAATPTAAAAPAPSPAPPPAAGSRKLEDVVARARTRERTPPPAAPAPEARPPVGRETAGGEVPPARDAPSPPPADAAGERPRGGLGWLRRRRSEEPPGGTPRRRPSRKD